jgi:hypothetical protein
MSIPADNQGYEMRTPSAQVGRRIWPVLILNIMILSDLSLRLQAAWQRNTEAPDELALRLVGDENGYEEAADALLHGSFFRSPVRVPIYPLFIAAVYYALGERSPAKLLYMQTFVGVAVVPLTYLLARRLTGVIPALVAAGIVAFDDSLIEQVAPQLTVVTSTIAQSDVAVPVKDARAASVGPSAAVAHETPTVLGRSSNGR